MPSFLSQYYLGDGNITMNPTTGLTNLQNQTVWTIEMWFNKKSSTMKMQIIQRHTCCWILDLSVLAVTHTASLSD